MEIVKELKGGSLSKTVVIFDGDRYLVRKLISRTHNREYGLVRWQSQIRKLQLLNNFLPFSTPIIERVGEENNYFFYDIPYYENSVNCSDALLQGESTQLIAESIVELLKGMVSIKLGSVRGSLSLYICEEILSPLQQASDHIDTGILQLYNNEKRIFHDAIESAVSIATELHHKYRVLEVPESLTHGNLTLENLLWDPNTKKLTMIDPYAETYCESIVGDISQLLQSSLSGYEYISEIYEYGDFSILEYPSDKIPKRLIRFSRILASLLIEEKWYSSDHLQLFRASQFTRMYPFKLEKSPRQAAAFMMHGIKLLRNISC